MYQSILVANRGLIQENCVRAIRELGGKAITVYDQQDKETQGVRIADEAYELKPESNVSVYFDVDQIVSLAKELNVDAVHPGYGFLAKNAEFAERLDEYGIAFIGQKHDGAIDPTNKRQVKEAAQELNIPLLPGSGACNSLEEVKEEAGKLGYPLIIKASFGYGGNGLVVVKAESELEAAYRKVLKSCEKRSMPSNEVYLEKYMPMPHHVEVPLLKDKEGKLLIFPELECSIQRRFQKILVETPSPIINHTLRNSLEQSVQMLADKLDLIGFASVEFLIQDDQAYFLEVNGYMQPLHSATGMLTGVDLLKEQIRLHSGESITLKAEQLNSLGHVLTANISAEDGQNGFVPSPGKIDRFHAPYGEGIMVQTCVNSGDVVRTLFDPMIAKLIVKDTNRVQAIQKMKTSLEGFYIDGINTSIPLLRAILQSKEFQLDIVNTSFIMDDDNRERILSDLKTEEKEKIASLIAALSLHHDANVKQILEIARHSDRSGSNQTRRG